MRKNNNILTNKITKESKKFIKWMYKKDNINYTLKMRITILKIIYYDNK